MSEYGKEQVRKRFENAERVELDGDRDDGRDPPPYAEEEPPLPAGAWNLPLNDTGNGQRVVHYHGRDFIWVPRVGWFVWDSRRWKRDADNIEVRRLLQQLQFRIAEEIEYIALDDWQRALIERIPSLADRMNAIEEAAKPQDRSPEQRKELRELRDEYARAEAARDALSGMRKAHRNHAKTTGNTDRINKAMQEGGVMLAHALEELDADALAINCRNGVIRFTVEDMRDDGAGKMAAAHLDQHERSLLMTKMIDVEFDPSAEAPMFDRFLERIQPEISMRSFLQRWFGLSLTGITGEQKMAFLYGHGANGKSALIETLWRIMSDYAATAKIESLTGESKRGAADATPDLMPLMGARAVRASEPEKGAKMKEGMIKELTGGEPILVRALHSDFIEVHPEFKLTVSGNYKPDIRGTDDGIWRRMLLIPFDVQIPDEEKDKDLPNKLFEREAAGIFRWMVDGLIQYLEVGLEPPFRVIEATKEYRAESDPVGTFLTECTVIDGDEGQFMEATALARAFNVWMTERDGIGWGARTISNALRGKADNWRHPATGRKFSRGKRKVTGYRGIRLTDTFAERVELAPSGGRKGDDRDEAGNWREEDD